MELKLEIGKSYINRLGETRRIVSDDENGNSPKKIYKDDLSQCYWSNGKKSSAFVSELDLIKEVGPTVLPYKEVKSYEIVDGTYGAIKVEKVDTYCVSLTIVPRHVYANELREAAKLFEQLAFALESNYVATD